MKLMLVEDEVLERTAMRRIIEESSLPFEIVAESDNGKEALELARSAKPDLMMVDIRIPAMNGLDLIRTVKEEMPDTIFIVASAYDYFDYAKEALALGVKEYMLKPVRKNDILKVLTDIYEETGAKSVSAENESAEGMENGSPMIKKALGYINDNYAKDISLNDVASAIPLNAFYFSRLFKQEVGSNFVEYLMHTRINQAKKLLSETTMTVTEIAEMVGYHDSNYFSRVFRREVGESPRNFRHGGVNKSNTVAD